MGMRFECYKCGGTIPFFAPEGFVPNASETTIVGLCPSCSKITYGPLTEEMVAEALWEAYRAKNSTPVWERQGGYVKDGTRAQARFVLNLLMRFDGVWRNGDQTFDLSHVNVTQRFTRKWLFDIAKQK